MNVIVIINPTAGSGSDHSLLDGVLDCIAPIVKGVVTTEKAGDAEKATVDAVLNDRGIDVILVAGGDGTVNEVVNGLYLASTSGKVLPLVGVIPVGTQNVFAREIGYVGLQPEEWFATLTERDTQWVDVGVAGSKCFTLMAGFGFDAAVVSGVQPNIKSTLGPGAYAVSFLKTLPHLKSFDMLIEMDGKFLRSDVYLMVIANASSYAIHQMRLAPFASIDDGWLDVCIFSRAGARHFSFLGQLFAMVFRRHLKDPSVSYYRAKTVKVQSSESVACQIDGDMFGSTPIDIRILPSFLGVIKPHTR